MRFSQRIGKSPVRVDFQLESMDIPLRMAIWNAFYEFFLEWIQLLYKNSNVSVFHEVVWAGFYYKPLNKMPDTKSVLISEYQKWFEVANWYEIYDLIEFVVNMEDDDGVYGLSEFTNRTNSILEMELSGYRIVSGKVVSITSSGEILAIESAINDSSKIGLMGVSTHLKSALDMISNKRDPDYRNSIKESICAVESISKIISGNMKGTLGDALASLEKSSGIVIHAAMKKSFLAIYGYTSDEGGIRHAMIESNSSDFEDAKYMLVTCSAFVNYLTAKAEKASIRLID